VEVGTAEEDLTKVWRVVGTALLDVTTAEATELAETGTTELLATTTAEDVATAAAEDVATVAAEDETTDEVSDDPDPPTVKSTQDS